MTPKEFIDENYFSLTLDCKREINEIYQALEDYAEAEQLTIPIVRLSLFNEVYDKFVECEDDNEFTQYLNKNTNEA